MVSEASRSSSLVRADYRELVELAIELVDGGYVAVATGDLGFDRAMEFWEAIQAHRPDGGYRFGVLDVTGAVTAQIDEWPASQATLESLHPAARLVRMTKRDTFRFAFVSTDPHAAAMIEDLRELSRFGTARAVDRATDVRRFDTVEEALAWCRELLSD